MTADKTVLLVEDNPNDELLTTRAFRKNNLMNEIVVAHDGVEALDYLFGSGEHAGRKPGMPDVVLLDLKLPRVDGLEVLRRMRADARTAVVPVVVLTSSRQDEDVLRSYQLGANSYVRKPVDFNQFLDAVKSLGVYWLAVNERPPIH